jgi:hypothetical protein
LVQPCGRVRRLAVWRQGQGGVAFDGDLKVGFSRLVTTEPLARSNPFFAGVTLADLVRVSLPPLQEGGGVI